MYDFFTFFVCVFCFNGVTGICLCVDIMLSAGVKDNARLKMKYKSL